LKSKTDVNLFSSRRKSLLLAKERSHDPGNDFYVVAAFLFFLAGIGFTAIPNPMIWGLFSISFGLLLDEYDFGFRRRR
jgi:hypothetical protein